MDIHITGNGAKPTVIFLAGFPDTSDVFNDNLVAELKHSYRIVGITLPGFDAPLRSPAGRCRFSLWTVATQVVEMVRGGRGSQRGRSADDATAGEADSPARLPPKRGVQPGSGTGTTTFFSPLVNVKAPDVTAEGPPQRDSATQRCPRDAPWRDRGVASRRGLLKAVLQSLLGLFWIPHLVHLVTRAIFGGGDALDDTPLWGYSFETVTELLREAVDVVMEGDVTGRRPMLVAHDWGCVFGFEMLLSNPFLFSRIVSLDIGGCSFGSVPFTSAPGVSLPHRPSAPSAKVPPSARGAVARVFACVAGARRPVVKALQSLQRVCRLNTVLIVGYQLAFSVAYLLPLAVGNCIVQFAIGLAGRPTYTYDRSGSAAASNRVHRFTRLSQLHGVPIRVTVHDAPAIEASGDACRGGMETGELCGSAPIVRPSARLCWIYVRYWSLLLLGIPPLTHRFFFPVHVPVLFMYGTSKAIDFNMPRWIDHIRAKGAHDGSRVVAIDGGHWFFAEARHRDYVAQCVRDFLDAEQPSSGDLRHGNSRG